MSPYRGRHRSTGQASGTRRQRHPAGVGTRSHRDRRQSRATGEFGRLHAVGSQAADAKKGTARARLTRGRAISAAGGWRAVCRSRRCWLAVRISGRPPRRRGARPAVASRRPASKSIETICVGQRVVTQDAGNWAGRTGTAVNPQTWKKLVLVAETHWGDGTRDDIHVETLQPPEWIKQHDVRIGATVPLPLDLVEMGLPRDLRATVLSVEHCPEIKEGPGRVVLSTVNHLNKYVFELTIRDAAGHSETVHATGFHKFFSASRNGWISAAELRKGEQLRGVNGALTVADLRRFSGVHRVYNMTVEDEHVYRVSVLGALVHNVCPGDGKSRWNMGKNAEEQLNDVEETQNNANANRPSIQDENSDWDGAKTRPKQNTVNKTDKSRGRGE